MSTETTPRDPSWNPSDTGSITMTPPDSDAIAYRLRHPTVDRGRRAPKLHLASGVLDAMVRVAEEGYPYESCGLLVGRGEDGPNGSPHAVRLAPAKNLRRERAADRYLLDPDDFMAADRAAQAEGLEIIGIWHSHPDSPAWPSVTDLEAAWEGYSYVIVSLQDGRLAEVRSWRLGTERLFLEEGLETE